MAISDFCKNSRNIRFPKIYNILTLFNGALKVNKNNIINYIGLKDVQIISLQIIYFISVFVLNKE